MLPVKTTIKHDMGDQPIYKLHGSVNWRTAAGSQYVVIGDGKDAAIRESPLLSDYFAKFRECLSAGNTKVIIIGHIFSDDHVNEILAEASRGKGLQTYLVNAAGISVFDPLPNTVVKPRNEVFETLRPVGISTRPFLDAFGSDDLSFNSFRRFVQVQP